MWIQEEESLKDLSDLCRKVYNAIKDMELEKGRAARRTELFTILKLEEKRDKNKLDRCLKRLEEKQLIVKTGPKHDGQRRVYIVTKGYENLLPMKGEITWGHAIYIAVGFKNIATYINQPVGLEPYNVECAFLHILTGDQYKYLRDLIEKNNIAQFKERLLIEANRILQGGGNYKLWGSCNICDPSLAPTKGELDKIKEWKKKIWPDFLL